MQNGVLTLTVHLHCFLLHHYNIPLFQSGLAHKASNFTGEILIDCAKQNVCWSVRVGL